MMQNLSGRIGIERGHLTVWIGGVLHAIPLVVIEEVLPALKIEPVAGMSEFIKGMVFVRGHLIPVLNVASILQLPPPETREPHLVCLRVHGRIIGIEVDEAIDLVEFPEEGRISVPDLVGQTRLISAVLDYHGELIRILNPEHILNLDVFHDLDSPAFGELRSQLDY